MIKLVTLIIILNSCLTNTSSFLSGIIIDDFGEPLHDVVIFNKTSQVYAKSDCDGRYKIKGNVNDTLYFSKIGFFNSKKQIKKKRKNKIMLGFDYPTFRKALKMENNLILGGGPLFIIDRKVWNSDKIYSFTQRRNNYLKEDEVDTVYVFKGHRATKYFGEKYTKNGVVMIYSTCKYKKKID